MKLNVFLFSFAFSLAFLISILYWIRMGRLRERYALLWLLLTAAMMLLSLFPSLIDEAAARLDVAYPPSLLYLFGLLALLLISLNLTMVVSALTRKQIILTQKMALMEQECRTQRQSGGLPGSAGSVREAGQAAPAGCAGQVEPGESAMTVGYAVHAEPGGTAETVGREVPAESGKSALAAGWVGQVEPGESVRTVSTDRQVERAEHARCAGLAEPAGSISYAAGVTGADGSVNTASSACFTGCRGEEEGG